MNDPQKLAAAIARVSSKEQRDNGYSLPAQQKILTEYAERLQFTLKRTYSIAETASKPRQRKIFTEMMDFLRKTNIKILIVEKVDRLTRSLSDLVIVDNWLEEDVERRVHFVKDNLVLHSKSRSQEKLNWGIRVVLAKNHIDNLKEEVEKGIAEKLAQGGTPGRHPIGYKMVRSGRAKELVTDPVMGPLVRRMFQLYLEPQHSTQTLTPELNRLGLRTATGRPVSPSRIWLMLRNPFYLGQIPWKDKIYEGKHEPLVDPATFAAIQTKLHGRYAPRRSRHNTLFRGLARCGECGSIITWQMQKGRYYGKCGSYRPCSRKKYLREDRAETMIYPYFDLLKAVWPTIAHWVQRDIRASYQEESAAGIARHRRLEARVADLARRTAIAYEDRLEGRIDVARYDQIAEKYKKERKLVEHELLQDVDEAARKERAEYDADMVMLCQYAREIYDLGSVEQRRKLLSLLFSNFTLEREVLACEWDSAAAVIVEVATEDRKRHGSFEPDDNGSTKQKEALFKDSYLLWWARRDELRNSGSVDSGKVAMLRDLIELLQYAPRADGDQA